MRTACANCAVVHVPSRTKKSSKGGTGGQVMDMKMTDRLLTELHFLVEGPITNVCTFFCKLSRCNASVAGDTSDIG